MSANLNSLREKGFGALTQKLGAVDSVRFIRQFEDGIDDYTRKRELLNQDITIDEIAESIYKRKAKMQSM